MGGRRKEESIIRSSKGTGIKPTVHYIYTILCWGTKIISGRSSRKLVIKDKEMVKGTQPDHISWLIGNPLGGDIIYI